VTSPRTDVSRQWTAFTAWTAEHGRTAIPATTETLAEFVAHLSAAGRRRVTIEQAVAAIRTAHRTAGHREQPDTTAARLVLRGHRRQRADSGLAPGRPHRSRSRPCAP